jgi:hypothetical protein
LPEFDHGVGRIAEGGCWCTGAAHWRGQDSRCNRHNRNDWDVKRIVRGLDVVGSGLWGWSRGRSCD